MIRFSPPILTTQFLLQYHIGVGITQMKIPGDHYFLGNYHNFCNMLLKYSLLMDVFQNSTLLINQTSSFLEEYHAWGGEKKPSISLKKKSYLLLISSSFCNSSIFAVVKRIYGYCWQKCWKMGMKINPLRN